MQHVADQSTPAPVRRNRLWKTLTAVATILLAMGVAGFLFWASNPSLAESGPLAEAQSSSAVQYSEQNGYFSLTRDDALQGFVFYPGGHVAAEAYLAKLEKVVEVAPVNIYVPKMPLSLAIFGVNKADAIIKANPGIKNWYVGGHSLGGAMACRYALDHQEDLQGLVLVSSYCDRSIANSKLAVITVVGDQDKLVTLDKLKPFLANIPKQSQLAVIEGANHGQMGNYGAQPGDGKATVTDGQVAQKFQDIIGAYFGGPGATCASCGTIIPAGE